VVWEDVLRTLGGTAILVAALAWLSKSLLIASLSKDLERFKSDLQATSQRSIESYKANLQLESQRHQIEYSTLHSKRAELVGELYSRVVDLHGQVIGLSRELGKRESRAESYKTFKAPDADPWEIEPGTHTLSADEEDKSKLLHESYKDFMSFYGQRRIYFSEELCKHIDSFVTLAGYMGVMYQNVALRDDDDQPYVNPLVLQSWKRSGEKIPGLLSALELEFRSLLGVVRLRA
jgi:hypothetical protein